MKLTIRKKLIGGFGLMVALAALLGGLGWSSLEDVSNEVAKANGATKLLEISQQGRAHQLEYQLSHAAADKQSAEEAVAEFETQADALIARLKKAEHQTQVSESKSAIQTWLQSLQQYAELEGQKAKAGKLMGAAANESVTKIETIATGQAQKLEADRKAAEEAAADRNWKAKAALYLQAESSMARITQLKYQINKTDEYATQTRQYVQEVLSKAQELEARFFEEADKELARKVQGSAQEYLKAFNGWVTTQADLEKYKKDLAEQGRLAIEEVTTLRDGQRTRLSQEMKDRVPHEKLKERLTKARNSAELLRQILSVAVSRRNFMIQPNLMDKKAVEDTTRSSSSIWRRRPRI